MAPRLRVRRLDPLPGGPGVPRRTRSNPFSRFEWRCIGRSLELSRRELDLVRCICRGLSNASIAVRLGLSPRTVSTYLDRLYRKLGVHSRIATILRVFSAFETSFPHRPLPFVSRGAARGPNRPA